MIKQFICEEYLQVVMANTSDTATYLCMHTSDTATELNIKTTVPSDMVLLSGLFEYISLGMKSRYPYL